jgi:hypothetical protein
MLNSNLGHAAGFAVRRDSIGVKSINSYLIAQVGPASQLPDHETCPKRWSQLQRGARQELEHLPLLIFSKLHEPPLGD